jgi:hypothetical protein
MNNNHIVMIVGLAILNGLFSPGLAMVFALRGLWYPFFLPAALPLVFLFSSLIVSTLTLMIAGVPAALYERISGATTNSISNAIWFAGVVLLTFPALPNLVKVLGLAP